MSCKGICVRHKATKAPHLHTLGKYASSSPRLMAKVVLEAVTNETPNLRYLAGKDAETWLDAKRNMSDEEFYKMMKQNWNWTSMLSISS